MKTLNINAEVGFTTEIETIQFYKCDYGYSANVAVKCGDTGIVLLCLSGDDNQWLSKDKFGQLDNWFPESIDESRMINPVLLWEK